MGRDHIGARWRDFAFICKHVLLGRIIYNHRNEDFLVTISEKISFRPGPRDPVHPSITKDQISDLVDQFYKKIHDDERLGPIFENAINTSSDGNWQPHLEKMKRFWASVLLKTGEYKGQPVVVHNGLPDLQENDFSLWLKLFASTIEDVMEKDAQIPVYESARRIAQSLYLSRFGSAGSALPF